MDFHDVADRFVLALTIFGESRGEPVLGQIAVGCVVRNRLTAATSSAPRWRDVCLAPEQFSCFNADDPNRAVLERGAVMLGTMPVAPLLGQALWIADGVMSGAVLDVTHGANHYLTTTLLKEKPPTWAVNQPVLAVIGAHSFLHVT